MARSIEQLIEGIVREELNEEYLQTRMLVESLVREELYEFIEEAKKKHKYKYDKGKYKKAKNKKHKDTFALASQVADALKDPAINMSGMCKGIEGLPTNYDSLRSLISKYSRKKLKPKRSVANAILHRYAAAKG